MSMMDLPKACCQANAAGMACTCDRYPAGYLAHPQLTPFEPQDTATATLRDQFAMHIIPSLVGKDSWQGNQTNRDTAARTAYKYADAMLLARNQTED